MDSIRIFLTGVQILSQVNVGRASPLSELVVPMLKVLEQKPTI